MKTIKPLEDFIIATILAEGKIVSTTVGKEIHFSIQDRKYSLLNSYIQNNDINQHIIINKKTYCGVIRQSIVLERLLKDWSKKGEIVAINPDKISSRVFLLSICLFAKKSNNGVLLDTNLKEEQLSSVLSLINLILPSTFRNKSNTFYIKPFFPLVLEAIRLKLTLVETAELNYLLPEKERKILKHKLSIERDELYARIKGF